VLDYGYRLSSPCFRSNAAHRIDFDLRPPILMNPVEQRLWDRSTPRHGDQTVRIAAADAGLAVMVLEDGP